MNWKEKCLQAQAAIADVLKIAHTGINEGNTCNASLIYRILDNISPAMLKKHDEEVRKPLVDALEKVRRRVGGGYMVPPSVILHIIDDAIAQVKEGK